MYLLSHVYIIFLEFHKKKLKKTMYLDRILYLLLNQNLWFSKISKALLYAAKAGNHRSLLSP